MRFEKINDNSDDTFSYKVHLEKEYTIGKFVDFVLTQNEWGRIHVKTDETQKSENNLLRAFGHTFDYSKNELSGKKIPQRLKKLKIRSVSADGGWGSMDYWIDAHEGDKDND